MDWLESSLFHLMIAGNAVLGAIWFSIASFPPYFLCESESERQLRFNMETIFRHQLPRAHLATQSWNPICFLFFSNIIYLFLERGEGRKKERERNQCVVVSHAPHTGDLAWNPGMCPTGIQTGNPLVCRLVLNPLSHTSQGPSAFF